MLMHSPDIKLSQENEQANRWIRLLFLPHVGDYINIFRILP
jgi:hypothetical protein